MALHLHRASRTDQLADALGELLAVPPADPFAEDLVVVPAAGVERWLSQRLSHRLGTGAGPGAGTDDGVCAGVAFRSPRSLLAELTDIGEADPWAPDALVWPLLECLDEAVGLGDGPAASWAAPLVRHLGLEGGAVDEQRLGRRFALAHRLARLLASYAAQRPEVVAAWSDGRATDGLGSPLPPDLAWQPPLWRAVVARIALPDPVAQIGRAHV